MIIFTFKIISMNAMRFAVFVMLINMVHHEKKMKAVY